MRLLLPFLTCLVATAAPAQENGKPLGDILESLPADDSRTPALPPAIPIVRPPPAVEAGRVATTELPPSSLVDTPSPSEEPAPLPLVAPPPPTDADAAWLALQDQRRQAVNQVEAPLVAQLNSAQATAQEEQRRRAEEAQADYERTLAEREAAIEQSQSDYQAALAAHAERVERERADYEARVAACLAGEREFCAPR